MFLGTQRRFGVEIEFTRANVNRDALARAITDAGVPCAAEGYNHANRSYWKIVTDASCGLEMVSPILQGESGFQDLKTVLDTMAEMGCTVNRSTGVHVHLEAADLTALDVKNIVTRYADNETEIDSWFPRSRRASNNQYCRPVSQCIDVSFRNFDEHNMDSHDAVAAVRAMRHRFCKVNLASLSRYNTIEFRQHAGTTDFNKVSNWVLFLQHFVEQSRKVKAGDGFGITAGADRRRWYGEIRNKIEEKGGSVEYNKQTRKWDLVGSVGSLAYSNDQMVALYNPDSLRSDGKTIGRVVYLDQEKWAVTWQCLFGVDSETDIDSSLNGGVPDSVVDFFNQRRDELAA